HGHSHRHIRWHDSGGHHYGSSSHCCGSGIYYHSHHCGYDSFKNKKILQEIITELEQKDAATNLDMCKCSTSSKKKEYKHQSLASRIETLLEGLEKDWWNDNCYLELALVPGSPGNKEIQEQLANEKNTSWANLKEAKITKEYKEEYAEALSPKSDQKKVHEKDLSDVNKQNQNM
ncbi:19106_t:CDS:2, partial [Gigaspora margarita]